MAHDHPARIVSVQDNDGDALDRLGNLTCHDGLLTPADRQNLATLGAAERAAR